MARPFKKRKTQLLGRVSHWKRKCSCTSSLASQCYRQGQVNLISERSVDCSTNSSVSQMNSSVSSRTHWPRTKLHHLLMNSMDSITCCCRQVISLNSRKDQRQHFLPCPLVVTSQGEVADFTRVRKGTKCMKLSQQAQNHSLHHFSFNYSRFDKNRN